MTNAQQPFLNEADTLIRRPLDMATGRPRETCRYALFPGMSLACSEPELVVLLYDSILHQYEDTAMFLYRGREGTDPLLNRKWSERLLTRWRNLGKPTVILTSPEDMKFFRGILTEIPTVSVYDELLAHNISGGCNRELYRLAEPAQFGFESAVRELAENMGAVIYEAPGTAGDDPAGTASGGGHAGGAGHKAPGMPPGRGHTVATHGTGNASPAPEISPADASKIPFLTSSMDVRNAMKKRGFEAVHILELIYGMGRSNQHLAHNHEGGAHEHGAPPKVRDTAMTEAERAATEELFSRQARAANLSQLRSMLLSLFWGESEDA